MVRRREWSVVCVALTAGVIWYAPGRAQIGGGASGEWRAYGATELSTHYAPFDQVNRGNVKSLGVAWRWRFDKTGRRPKPCPPKRLPSWWVGCSTSRLAPVAPLLRPLLAQGRHCGRGGPTRVPGSKRPRAGTIAVSRTGVTGRSARIIVVTPGMQLVALDAHTGRPMESFGEHGMVDLFRQLDNDSGLDPSGQVDTTPPRRVERCRDCGTCWYPRAGLASTKRT